jgi:hypothetical protein
VVNVLRSPGRSLLGAARLAVGVAARLLHRLPAARLLAEE